jgi:hypothetical protein
MQDLSDLHRDVEALNHLLQDNLGFRKATESSLAALKTHVGTMVERGILETVSKAPSSLVREDIPAPAEYQKIWRQLRTAPGSRDMHVLEQLRSSAGKPIPSTSATIDQPGSPDRAEANRITESRPAETRRAQLQAQFQQAHRRGCCRIM